MGDGGRKVDHTEQIKRFMRARPETLFQTLDMRMIHMTAEKVVIAMPVTAKVHQPMGLLHGGASVALAETAASIGGWLNVDPEQFATVGVEINANHLRPKKDGEVTATATPLHVGRTTHVWQIDIQDERGQLVCVSRCTLAVVPRPN